MIHVLHGDTAAAEHRLEQALRRAQQLGFPLNTYNKVWAIRNQIWVRAEAGQLNQSRAIAVQLTEEAERHGFGYWHRFGENEQCAIDARILLDSNASDPAALSAHTVTMMEIQDMYRRIGVAYRPINDAVVGRLLIVGGNCDRARAWLDTTLTTNAATGQRFYDAELLRVRAHTLTDPDERAAGFAAAADLARRQGAPLFELRASLDHYELAGTSARDALHAAMSRVVSEGGLPELSRAREILGR